MASKHKTQKQSNRFNGFTGVPTTKPGTPERADALQEAIKNGMRTIERFTAEELAALQVRAEEVFNGHQGLNLQPWNPDVLSRL
jgi:hypothetical protein